MAVDSEVEEDNNNAIVAEAKRFVLVLKLGIKDLITYL